MSDREENDLTTDELLGMWAEGTPVELTPGFAPDEASKRLLNTSAPTSVSSGSGKTERFPGATIVPHSGQPSGLTA